MKASTRYRLKRFLNGALITLAVVIAMLLLTALIEWADAYGCHTRWKDSGTLDRHTFWGGCQIQMPDGRWIPEISLKAYPDANRP